MDKVGTRYETALALAKRARQIQEKRIKNEDGIVRDTVDEAAEEILNDKIIIEKVNE